MTNTAPAAFAPIAVSSESTVVAEFHPEERRETAHQSEAQLENEFIQTLTRQAYERLTVTSEADLIANLRTQLQLLNGYVFSESEWDRFYSEAVSSENSGIHEKTKRIQEDHVQNLRRDDGTVKNIRLIDKDHIHNNRLQVLNQYEATGAFKNRYDVTILVNGLPLVHVELKRRGVPIREAFNQIDRYQRDSFWAGTGLFQYVQLFVISNGTHTKYYSNTTRLQHVEEAWTARSRKKASSHSFEFTSWWADFKNQPIRDLVGFTKTFFAKHTLLNILTKYCVLTADGTLLVMRPYQIAATEKILERVGISTHYKQYGSVQAGGYIWHTTGSGKTLTSFKAAQLATKIGGVDKVIFVVDRKDLDHQTMREYEKFQKGAANSNTSTEVLKRQLGDPSAPIIITTIQKLSRFVSGNKQHEVFGKHVVLIFDECHRSQFGEMHAQITKAFKKYHLFGFTGTPIFAQNSGSGGNPMMKTTEQAFGDRLHAYTIVDAIRDKNVLPFRIDYINTIRVADTVKSKQVSAIDTEEALLSPQRVEKVVAYIREHYDQKTRRTERYAHQGKRLQGFNSLFATASIKAARTYYQEFKKQQQDLTPDQRLKVGIIFSYSPNEADVDGIIPDEEFDTTHLSGDARTFLEGAISDYNAMFQTNFDTSSDGFQRYYESLSLQLKNRELDMVIVVNMFLTGFDATTLNTLWVDKNLRTHGLIQAFSRTNRILNSVKTYGNVVCFRNLEDATNEAISLFGNKDAQGIVLLKPYKDFYAEYQEIVGELLTGYPLSGEIVGESAEKEFIGLFGQLLRVLNVLVSFDEFQGQELITPRDMDDYRSKYLDLYDDHKKTRDGDKESILDDLEFEIELVKQVEINVDYILKLVDQVRKERGNGDDKEILASIRRAMDASPSLRDKKDLIEDFVSTVTTDGDIDEEWAQFITKRRDEEIQQIITEENLKPAPAHELALDALKTGEVPESGTRVASILPPMSRFGGRSGGKHAAKKETVVDRFRIFVERFSGLV
ncbi:type I restriction endonuclease subunit R [Leucobacter sp. W1478]|uniref:type I restriction endonuclease subunit R n=1 Tax=Leucobacter sp. W1478 TaxID=3439065 RepID=UPI003F3BB480